MKLLADILPAIANPKLEKLAMFELLTATLIELVVTVTLLLPAYNSAGLISLLRLIGVELPAGVKVNALSTTLSRAPPI